MDELFSCRNCVHNSGQTLNVGQGIGYCLQHNSIIRKPNRTTCKYLRRKDLPWFVVNESRDEHAAEFSAFSGLADLFTREPIKSAYYSEQYAWEDNTFDSITNAIARYHLSSKKWIFIETFTGGIDGRRSIVQSSLTRRYMSICDSWKSSFRLILDVVQQLPVRPSFLQRDLLAEGGGEQEAMWDVIFSRLSLVQEYGWHAGLPELQWITDSLSSLNELDWSSLEVELTEAVPTIIDQMFVHAKENQAYFAHPPVAREDSSTEFDGEFE